jgi:S-adenosylmethionine hydrolase
VTSITLLTDFGLKDAYVGVMKGVILSINPDVHIVDISHDVEPQDITEGCFLIKEYVPFFRRGSVHLCVIDPTVGSDRRPIVVSHEGHLFVGPDNGLFSLVLDGQSTAHQIENEAYMLKPVSGTFHGRDIFAPVAAHLSLGLNPALLGREITDAVRLTDLEPRLKGNVLKGRVVRFDRFGNAISNIPADAFSAFVRDEPFTIHIGDLTFDVLSRSYYQREDTCLVGSSGYIEFASFGSSFATKKDISKNASVRVTTSPRPRRR